MNIEELGRRAVACKHWKWMPGMYLLPHVDGCECCKDRDFPRRAARLPSVFTTDTDVPDLRDPATLGCLLHLLREAWLDKVAYICTLHYGSRWFIDLPSGEVVCRDTETEALVTALEAAP